MTIWEHLEELRERALISFGSVAALILVAFCFSKDLVIFLEQPVATTVRGKAKEEDTIPPHLCRARHRPTLRACTQRTKLS